ncbi:MULTISPECIES: hypothetical protein [unclassified Bradyrhizobium]|uniref:hypothetical protein n=1 Tax=unclassified Bradyrhizobium TaxID=2631580 RepID=UPI0028EAC782|nr:MULTISPECIES: hypothetical protein [unclassified Bradyrhizobium]
MVRYAAVVFGLSCLASAALAQAPATPRPEAGRPCIGVIAAADRFMVTKIGFTAFDTDILVAPIESWGLDDLIAARVRVAAGTGVTVLRLTYPKGAFEPFYDPPSRPAPPPGRQLTEIVRRIAGSTRCRRYVVITASPGAYSPTNKTIAGVGVYQASLTKKAYLYAHLLVTVFDGESFAIRQNPYATFQSRLERAFVPRKDFDREIDPTLFPSSAAEAANSAALRNGARSVVAESLDDLLPAFFRE